jgi:AcrR family transcriptional regulator
MTANEKRSPAGAKPAPATAARSRTGTKGSPARRRRSDERREHVIAAAVAEFARHGYHGASTGAIARRAGISQPYIYALFPSKQDLFLAANTHVVERIRRRFVEAARGGADPGERIHAMAESYHELLESREEILFQLQSYAAGLDLEIREHVRRQFMDLFDEAVRVTGASRPEVSHFFAAGMLLNVVAALDLPEEYEPTPLEEKETS